MDNLNRLDSETELQYIWRICNAKDSGILEYTWEEVANLLNYNLRDEDEYWTSSAYRKKFQQAKAFYDDVFSKMVSGEYNETIMDQKRELEKLKVQYRDERNAWQKQNVVDARVSQKLDYLEEVIKEFGIKNFNHNSPQVMDSDNDLLIMLSDLHIGQTFDSAWGTYNSEVAHKRFQQYLAEILAIQKRHNSETAYVSIQGDLLSGAIHKTIAITNRENVIDQIKIASELIAGFCNELSKNFKEVIITNVSGNHSRIDKKDEALHDERLDDLIGWIVSKSLSNVENVYYLENNIDNGIAVMNIRGKKYVNVHGDFDSYNKSGVSKLCMMLQFFPYAITYGHLHSPAYEECNGIKMIRGGSLAGSGDAYTIEKRLSGKPNQVVCVCSEAGVDAFYSIDLY